MGFLKSCDLLSVSVLEAARFGFRRPKVGDASTYQSMAREMTKINRMTAILLAMGMRLLVDRGARADDAHGSKA
jgi:hypothetical protein